MHSRESGNYANEGQFASMKPPQFHQIKDVARAAGVSARTLQYYDDIGLLTPGRSKAGYRLYSNDDILRLQQILIGRTLGLSLEEIKQTLDDPAFDRRGALLRQRALLLKRAAQTSAMIAAIDAAIDHLSPQGENVELKDILGGFDPAQHEVEVKARWGDTPAYRASAQRTKSYGETEWREIKAEADSIWVAAAEAMREGAAPDGEIGATLAERHRRHVDRWFYPISLQLHAKLADMWESDARFSASIDRHGQGLTVWIVEAVRAALRQAQR
ncbi:MAG: MerR family transcriptional regulator [Hyphomonadaceae bacterium JAD_PAG50586_4]|nr:MAG: MerR family transcriptional regulator [Hyphomonadaceae bacterium JAD_PAG50586_4]